MIPYLDSLHIFSYYFIHFILLFHYSVSSGARDSLDIWEQGCISGKLSKDSVALQNIKFKEKCLSPQ